MYKSRKKKKKKKKGSYNKNEHLWSNFSVYISYMYTLFFFFCFFCFFLDPASNRVNIQTCVIMNSVISRLWCTVGFIGILLFGSQLSFVLLYRLYRHIAYRRFPRWVYGLLGKRIRKVIPFCAVVAIREAFPSEEYCGFRYPQ